MAIQIIREVSADVVKRGATRAVYAKQNDKNSRFLNVRIQEDGVDIKVESTATVVLNVERPDKQENIFYGTVNADGTVKIPLTPWMLELEGTLLCDISIIEENVSKLTTMQFNIYVEAAVVSDASFEETEEYSLIIDLLNRTNLSAEIASAAADNATEAAKQADALKSACENATIKANEASGELNAIKAELAKGGYIHSIEEQNQGAILSFWVGTQAEYDALATKANNCFYIITDDNSIVDLINDLFESKSFSIPMNIGFNQSIQIDGGTGTIPYGFTSYKAVVRYHYDNSICECDLIPKCNKEGVIAGFIGSLKIPGLRPNGDKGLHYAQRTIDFILGRVDSGNTISWKFSQCILVEPLYFIADDENTVTDNPVFYSCCRDYAGLTILEVKGVK